MKNNTPTPRQKKKTDRRTIFVRIVAGICALLLFLSAFLAAIDW